MAPNSSPDGVPNLLDLYNNWVLAESGRINPIYIVRPSVRVQTASPLTIASICSRLGQRSDNRLIRNFSLTADQTPMQFMIAYVVVEDTDHHHADTSLKHSTCRWQTGLLHLLLIAQGWRLT